jgi:membrane dipeptidase
MPLIVDSHQDLAWNMLNFGRDYTRSTTKTRELECGSPIIAYNGDSLLGWPDFQRGQVAVVFSTLFATPARRKTSQLESVVYPDTDFEAAHRLYRAQVDEYSRLVEAHPDKFRLIRSIPELEALIAHWQEPEVDSGHPVGLVLLMEGADGIRNPSELDEWWELGLRLIGLAWAGNRYCGGTREPGPLTEAGRALLRAMYDFNFCLDVSHMDETAALQALDSYPGPVVSTHGNCAALLSGSSSNRHLTDAVIRRLIDRQGVIGVVPYNWFLKADWKKGDSRQGIHLDWLVPHIDHICQMAGDAHHVGIGSDYDGGFGLQSVPEDVDTIADLQNLAPLLSARGYSQTDIRAILGENWLNHLRKNLPAS